MSRPAAATAGDDDGRVRLVDHGLVRLVHDGHVERPLHHGFLRVLQVVAEEVEPKLPERGVDDVAAIRVRPLHVVHLREHRAHAQAQRLVHGREKLGVPGRQVVVRGDDVYGPAQHGVEHRRKGGGDGLAFARGHLHYRAFEQQAAGPELLVGGTEPRLFGDALSPQRPVEAARQHDVGGLGPLGLLGDVYHLEDDCAVVGVETGHGRVGLDGATERRAFQVRVVGVVAGAGFVSAPTHDFAAGSLVLGEQR